MSLSINWLEPVSGNDIMVGDDIYLPGMLVQCKTASSGPYRQAINSTIPQPIDGLRIEFVPKFDNSLIIVDVQIQADVPTVSNYSVYKDDRPTADLEGLLNNSSDNGAANLTIHTGAGATGWENTSIPLMHFDYDIKSGKSIVYDIRAQTRWKGTNYTLSINNPNNDRAGFGHMTIMEIAQ